MARSIPRNIHFIRIGAPLTEEEKVRVTAWIRLNPAYLVSVWVEEQYIEDLVSELVHELLSEEQVKSMQSRDDRGGAEIQIRLTLDRGRQWNFVVRSIWSIPGWYGEEAFRHEMEHPRNLRSAVDTLKLSIIYRFGGIYLGLNVTSPSMTQPQYLVAPQEVLIGMTRRGDELILQDNVFAASEQSAKVKSLLTMVIARNKNIIPLEYPPELFTNPDSGFGRWAKDHFAEHEAIRQKRYSIEKGEMGELRSGIEFLQWWLTSVERVDLYIEPHSPPPIADVRDFGTSSDSSDEGGATAALFKPRAPVGTSLRLSESFSTLGLESAPREKRRFQHLGVTGQGASVQPDYEALAKKQAVLPPKRRCVGIDITSYWFQEQTGFRLCIVPAQR